MKAFFSYCFSCQTKTHDRLISIEMIPLAFFVSPTFSVYSTMLCNAIYSSGAWSPEY